MEIAVRRYVGTYIASYFKVTASATAGPQYAAKRCAMKLFPGATITDITLTEIGDEREGYYRFDAQLKKWGKAT